MWLPFDRLSAGRGRARRSLVASEFATSTRPRSILYPRPPCGKQGPELGCARWLVEPASPGRGVLVDVPSSLASRYSRSDRGGKLPPVQPQAHCAVKISGSPNRALSAVTVIECALCAGTGSGPFLRWLSLSIPAPAALGTWARRRRFSNGESPGRGPRHSRRAPRCGNHRHQPPHEQISSATVPHKGSQRKGASRIAQPRPAAAEGPLPANAQRRSYPGISRDSRDSSLR
ncbi:MAG: hypothetical protein QOE87_2649 [Gaiellales bacterium]|nr:hypothetical protein [Gaiellales bacterium]